MNRVFADTHYFLALLNPRDQDHLKAIAFSNSYQGGLLTSEYVLLELADALAKPAYRQRLLDMIHTLQTDPTVEIIPAQPTWFEAGLTLFAKRMDKDWPLTDCINMVIMDQHQIHEILTADQHFKQAGYVTLL